MHHFYKYETELVQLTLGNFGNFKKYAKCYGIYSAANFIIQFNYIFNQKIKLN